MDPLVEISARDHWIYKNPEALASLMRGIEDAKKGRLVDISIILNSFNYRMSFGMVYDRV